VTLNFLQLTFLAEELTIPQYVAPAVIFALVVLAMLMFLVFGRRPSRGRECIHLADCNPNGPVHVLRLAKRDEVFGVPADAGK
jgi:hypothetical protein